MKRGIQLQTEPKDAAFTLKFLLFLGVAIAAFILSFSWGRYPVPAGHVVRILWDFAIPGRDPFLAFPTEEVLVVTKIRLPRIAMAGFIGMALSLAGSALQAVFQNPLVSPSVLGTSNGAAFGACLALLMGLGYRNVVLIAFAFGLLSMLLVFLIGSVIKTNKTLGLIMCGILISSLFSSGISLIKTLADPNEVLPAITYWLIGSFASARTQEAKFVVPLIIVVSAILLWFSWYLNVLTLPDGEAEALGVPVAIYRFLILFFATLLIALSVSVSGVIGWVGLVIPHLARLLTGQDYRRVLPLSAVIGFSFMLLTDDIARIAATTEIPIGILTSFLGAPFYLYLILTREKRGIL